MIDTLKNLSEYNIWANARVLELFRNIGEPPADSRSLFSHVLNAQSIWLCRIINEGCNVTVWQEHAVDEMEKLHKYTSYKLAEVVARADDAELNRKVSYTNSQGNAYVNQVSDMLTHAFTHAGYHRAQVMRDLRANGFEPVNTDYITYVRETKS
ncbi:MAG: damage-inducible protein DinB [Hymenobacteraceae bacterium]|nr:damage-inducible protein DinB [Hymenobacteraceae bacterium]MDX5397102.1 damage-inducible protein DinB [Hymenobacteraceae bacterium]MDX5513180.1 damage-inducible protein DinB [Hymenobacteraceae bacterium]